MARSGKGAQAHDKGATDGEWSDKGPKSLQVMSGVAVGAVAWLGAPHIIDPGQIGFLVDVKRCAFTTALTAANMGTMSLLVTRAAPLAAQGSQAARSAILACCGILVPLNTAIGYLSLSATQVPKLEALEICADIRTQTSGFDQVAAAQGQLVRNAEAQAAEFGVRQRQEQKTGRDTKRPSIENKREPVAMLWGDAQRAAESVREKFAQGDLERTTRTRSLADIADQCERSVRDPKRWAKGGAATVVALHDRAAGVTRELALASPIGLAQALSDIYRSIGKDQINTDGVAEVRRHLAEQASRLDKDIAAMPRVPDPMASLPASSLISAAFDGERMKALWPLLLAAFTVELGGPLAVMIAYLVHRRRHDDRRGRDDDDTPGGTP